MIIEKYAKVGERGQVAIPKEMREQEGIGPKDIVKIVNVNGEITIRPLRRKTSPESRILEILRSSKLKDGDWEEIRKDRKDEVHGR